MPETTATAQPSTSAANDNLPQLIKDAKVAALQERKSIKLARDVTTEGNPFKKPVTESFVNMGMGRKIFFPVEAAQRKGFTPYSIDAKGELQDESKVVLNAYRGIYIPYTEKG